MWWTIFGDPLRNDDFHDASKHLFQSLDRSPSSGSPQRPPFALDVDARIAELNSTGDFDEIQNEMFNASVIFETAKLVELYATFSEVSRLHPIERNLLLEELARIAEDHFNGEVEKPIVTSIYSARRKLT
jgi:hypothetical protein